MPDLRHEVDRVLGAPVGLGVAALAAEALDLGQGEALDADRLQRLLHLVELERLDHCDDELHQDTPSGAKVSMMPVRMADCGRLDLLVVDGGVALLQLGVRESERYDEP